MAGGVPATPGSTIPAGDQSVDLLLSKSVLEHVSAGAVPALVDETYRVLRPGGGAVHMIDLRDHLWIDGDERVTGEWLDALRYSPRSYRLQFSHRSTYINRLREPDWRREFERAGFAVAGWHVTRFPFAAGFDRAGCKRRGGTCRWRRSGSDSCASRCGGRRLRRGAPRLRSRAACQCGGSACSASRR